MIEFIIAANGSNSGSSTTADSKTSEVMTTHIFNTTNEETSTLIVLNTNRTTDAAMIAGNLASKNDGN